MAVSMVHHQESSSLISRYTYHVFLSFRGTDTRKNFTDHLYMALVQAGIHTFRDDDEIERGENIRDKIERAMQESKIFIIVFSKNYASSTWCLNELVKILEHRKFSKHIVLPIFYDVNPSQVKKQTESFAEAFARHEESFKSEMDVVQRWRAALREVADLGGMLLEDSLERLMLKDCTKLIEVDQSIGEIMTLTVLNLKGCKSLRKLPKTIGSLESLEELILSGCSTLDDVPRNLQNMKSLRVLNLDGTAICESNSWLSWLSLKRSKELGFFWASLPCSLVKLSLESCRLSDDVMPADLSYLPSLKSLNLSRNPIRSLPKSISRLGKLDELLLTCCKDLQWLPKLPISLNGLRMKMYQSMYSYASLSLLLSLKRFILFGCEKLTKIEGVFKFEPFENFEIEEIKCLFNMDSINSIQLQVYNYLTDTKMITTPQVFHEGGITSCFVSESEVPISFKHRCKGPKISFSLPQNPSEKVSWLNLCIEYSLVSDEIFEFLPSVYIVNETKELVWAYFSSFIGIPKTKSDTVLWVIHWPVKEYQLENGDLVSCKLISSGLKIREFGVTYVAKRKDIHENDTRLYCQGNEDIWRKIKVKVNEELLNLGSSGNVKVQIYNYLEEPIIVASPQVLYDCGIISMFVPYDFACWGRYSHHVIGNKVSFTVARSSSQQICWLNFMVALVAEDDQIFDFLSRIEIVNETKSTTWTYYRRFIGIPKAKNTLYWLSSWRFMGEDGDRVSFTVFSDLYVKECVIDLIYEPDDNLLHKCNSTYQHSPGTSAIFRWLFPVFVYLLFMSQRTLYRIRCLDKCE
ncbi:TMV resistance protein N [Theobroma cacao]|uniref:ADP-ribosyl cyclase/cyclic ADP-ribose hydrolase n=1 Tax=Theobroma cacao TaxID=3641 RepID=A0A061EY44_THECC|nr:TMV resistance protein N [Theobroma cacao]